jgi:hypothetical protein
VDPIGLGRANAAWSSSLERLVDLSSFRWDLSALFEVESLHIRNRLIDPADGRRVANSSLRSIACTQMSTVDTPNSYLSFYQLLSSFGVTSSNVLACCGKYFNHLRADKALAIRKTVAVTGHGEQHSLLRRLIRLSVMNIRSAISKVRGIPRRSLILEGLMVRRRVVWLVVLRRRKVGHGRSSPPHLLMPSMRRRRELLTCMVQGAKPSPTTVWRRLVILRNRST